MPSMTRRTAVKDWSEDEESKDISERQQLLASPPDDDRRSRLRSRKRPAPTQSAPLTSSDEDVQPLSRLRSYASQRSRLNSNTGNVSEDTKSKRSSRRLSTARNGKGALASDDDPEEEQDEPAPARRRSLRSRSDVPVDHGAASQKQVQAPAGSHSGPSTRAASRSNRAQPTEQEDQPERALRSRSTRAASRAKAAAPQHDSSPEESSDEGSEPQRLRQRSARASRQARKASKLVQGGGGISDDDDSASDLDDFLAPSEDDAEEPPPSLAATNADESDAEPNHSGPAATPEGSPRKTASRQPGTATLRRLRKAQLGEDTSVHANGLADALEDSEHGSEPFQHVPEEAGQHSEPGYHRYTPEEKGKQKVVDEAGPSGLHDAQTPVRPAQQQSKARGAPEYSSGGRQATKRRRLQKADGRTVKAEEELTIASRVTRSGRVRKERPDYRVLWESKTAKAKIHKANSADELADTEDDSGHDGEQEDPAIVIVDDDEEEEESADDQDHKPAGAHNQGRETSRSLDVNDFIDEDGEAEVDDGRPVRSPLQLAGLFDSRPDVDNCFNFYLDYLLECIADPEFPEIIRGDARARKHYDYAIHKIEIDELARWREIYTKSDAWKRAIPGFITALERLPGCSVQPREDGLSSQNRKYSSSLADDDFEGTVRECAACTRKHTRAAMQLVLKGKLGDPGYIRGAKRLKDMAIRDDDEGESGSDRGSILDAEDGEFRERVYDVGSHCGSRVHLYHSLWHYKRRLCGQLKKELKAARLFLEGCGQPHSRADCVKHVKDKDGLYDGLRSNFKQLGQMASEYATMQASGGFRSASGVLDRVTKKVSQLMYRLNDDSDADSGSKLQSDTDDDSAVVIDEDEAGPSEPPAEEPEEAALPRSASGDARRKLVLEEDDSDDDEDARDAHEAQNNATQEQPSLLASAHLGDHSEESAPQAGAEASARRQVGQVIASSSEDEQQAAASKGKHASSAGKQQQQQRYRKPAGQPRYMPPAKRQSGRRAEDALKRAAASFQAAPSRAGRPARSPAASPERETAPGTPEHSGSPGRRPQPYFMASPQRRRETPSKQHAEPSRVGSDLGALLRQAQGSDAAQRLASLKLPGTQGDGQWGADANGEGMDLTTERSGSLGGEGAVQQMALAAAAASREALAALSYPDDSPRSPGTGRASQRGFQQSADLDALEVDEAIAAEQAAGDVDSAKQAAERSAAPVAAMDCELAPAQSEGRSAPAQTPSKPQSGKSSQTSSIRQTRGGSRGSKGNVDKSRSASKVLKSSDSVSAQKGILKYFSPRSKG